MKKKPAKKHPGGRPTKYKKEYCTDLVKFFSIEPYKNEVSEFVKEYYKDGTLKKESEKLKIVPSRLPTLFGFSRSISVDYTTVYRWSEKYERFRNAYNAAKELQKEFLMAIGLAGAAPPASYIFTAKNITDMRDKQEVESTKTFEVTGLEKLNDEELDGFIKGLQSKVGNRAPGEAA
jgi:hypothetical protein